MWLRFYKLNFAHAVLFALTGCILFSFISCNNNCEVWVSEKGEKNSDFPHDNEIIICDERITAHVHNRDLSDDGMETIVKCIKNEYAIEERIQLKDYDNVVIYVLKNRQSERYDIMMCAETDNNTKMFDDAWLMGEGFFDSLEGALKVANDEGPDGYRQMVPNIMAFGTEYKRK